ISSVGRKPLQEDILKLIEIFPVSDSDLATKSTVVPASSNTDKRTLATTLAYFASHDIDTPLHLSPTTDVKNPDKTILAIDENGLGLNFKGNYADARITSVYQTTIASMFNLVLGDGPQNSTSATVPASWTEVAKDNYFAWTMIRKKQESLDSAYQQPMKDLEQTLSGISAATLDDRSNKCVKFVNGNVGEIAGHYFVEKVFGDRGRKEVESIIAHLQSMYTKSFPKYEWLDKTTLQGALTKMATMDVKVGWSVSNPDTGRRMASTIKATCLTPKAGWKT
ncbi:hypothetical protein BGZ59_004378, partial [Podila verticillata]